MTISIRETDGGTRAATADELAQIRTDINAAIDAADVSQAEAEAGTEVNRRRWSVQRVWQAAAAYVATIKGAVNGVAGLNGASEVPSANLPGIPGTGGVFALPLIKNQGASSAVALAMETFSGSMTKNGKLTSPTNPEQGVIQFGAGVWTMEKTCAINLSGAGVSRFGLCIRGQGDGSTPPASRSWSATCRRRRRGRASAARSAWCRRRSRAASSTSPTRRPPTSPRSSGSR